MGSLTGASTYADVVAQYDDNASYDVDNDLGQARLYIEAVRILMRRAPAGATKTGNNVSFNRRILKEELANATEWLRARDPDSRVGPDRTYADFQDLRELVEPERSNEFIP